MSYPPVHPQAVTQAAQWSTGLCDCGDDVPNCCITCWCPCITFGKVAEIVEEGSKSCGAQAGMFILMSCLTVGHVGCYTCCNRTKLRNKYVLGESPCCDCCVHYCCLHCALCQEYRELKNRGFDMDIGWQGNMQRRNNGITMAPVVQGGMTK